MAEFKQMRRHIPVSIVCRSETMYRYLGQKGGQLVGATQRIATLYESTEDNDENRDAVVSIFETNFEHLEEGQSEFARQADAVKRKYRKQNRNVPFPEIEVPDNHKVVIDVTHPVFQRVLQVIRKFDNSMAVMEVLWMVGDVDEERYKYAKIKLASTMSRFSNDVFRITNQLRSLDTGRGTTHQRVNQQINQKLKPVEVVEEVTDEQPDNVSAPLNEAETEQEAEPVDIHAGGAEILGEDEDPLSAEEIQAVITQKSDESLQESA
ncbi:hypothetical protein OH460_26315 [Vibrio sp. Makdt]|uniref:hypothetical protein n=1 Tax=Vibrio sp. Makdt TaxID=2998828 RepID=UPI0022CD2CE5|nr:hypothetical protein [Vibrio sp. Makdt]MDA0155838.1 hypothetical protein [Vibrio sp. Makdt]